MRVSIQLYSHHKAPVCAFMNLITFILQVVPLIEGVRYYITGKELPACECSNTAFVDTSMKMDTRRGEHHKGIFCPRQWETQGVQQRLLLSFLPYLAGPVGRVRVGELSQPGVVRRGQRLMRRRVNCYIHGWRYIHFSLRPSS